MKEYLRKNQDETYSYIGPVQSENAYDDLIGIPDGAEIAIFYPEDNDLIFYTENFEFMYVNWRDGGFFNSNWGDMKHGRLESLLSGGNNIVWQRSETGNTAQEAGMKYDSDKPRYSLLPKGAVNAVIDVLEFGAKKYEADNWQKVDNAKERYYNAAMRHIDKWWNGEKHDPETNIHHLAHASTNLFFLMWFDK